MSGGPALFCACLHGYAHIARILLDYGAVVNHQTLVSRMFPMAQYTRAHQRCFHLTTKQGTSPLYIASQEGHLDVIQVLLEYGASVNLVNDVSRYPMV